MIQVDEVSKYFGSVLAVDRISFEVSKGEIVGFLGPNGAGKSTTMRILTTYLPATKGIAKVAGYDVMNESMQVRRNIGYLPENVPLYTEMRVEEYLIYRAKLKAVDRKERAKRVEFALSRCRLQKVRQRLIGTLSKGYRQRVGLADAIVHDPPILILDEPTAGLDPIQIRETLAFIKELGETHTILLSTHQLSEVEAICERAIIINAGRIGDDRTLAEMASEAIVLDVRGPSDQVTKTLRGLDGVTEVSVTRIDGDLNAYEIKTDQERDLREDISRAVAGKGWLMTRLDREYRQLADAFFEVLAKDDPLKQKQSPGTSEKNDAIKT